MTDPVREQVRERYAAAAAAVTGTGRDALAMVEARQCCARFDAATLASCCEGSAEVLPAFGSTLYSADEHHELPVEAVAASLGCGNPIAVAELRAGEKVLDLGSGGGIDVLLSARRVGPTRFAYGVDMTDEMLDLARANATRATATNVAFLKGTIEDIPLPDASVDVVIPNCVINLSTDKPAVLAEMFRRHRSGHQTRRMLFPHRPGSVLRAGGQGHVLRRPAPGRRLRLPAGPGGVHHHDKELNRDDDH